VIVSRPKVWWSDTVGLIVQEPEIGHAGYLLVYGDSNLAADVAVEDHLPEDALELQFPSPPGKLTSEWFSEQMGQLRTVSPKDDARLQSRSSGRVCGYDVPRQEVILSVNTLRGYTLIQNVVVSFPLSDYYLLGREGEFL
jgi:hypothetical protein